MLEIDLDAGTYAVGFNGKTYPGIPLESKGPIDVVEAHRDRATLMLPVKKRSLKTCVSRRGWARHKIAGCQPRRMMRQGPHAYEHRFVADDILQLRKKNEKLVTTFVREKR